MEKIVWTEITQDDVIKAIESFLTDTPDYPEPRSTYVSVCFRLGSQSYSYRTNDSSIKVGDMVVVPAGNEE